MRTLPSPPEPRFFQGLELANTGYGTSIHFKNIDLQYFAILFKGNIIVAKEYLKTTVEKFCEKKSFNHIFTFRI